MSSQSYIDHHHASPCPHSRGRVIKKPVDFSDASREKPVNAPAVCTHSYCSSVSVMQEFYKRSSSSSSRRGKPGVNVHLCVCVCVCVCVCAEEGVLYHCHIRTACYSSTSFYSYNKAGDKAPGVGIALGSVFMNIIGYTKRTERKSCILIPWKESLGWGLRLLALMSGVHPLFSPHL